jgi:hypothetical protein
LHKIIEIDFEDKPLENRKIILYKIMIEGHTQIWFEKHPILKEANFVKQSFASKLA